MRRTVLITGGGKRLGAAIAEAVAGAGHRVVLHYGSSRDAAEALAGRLCGATVQGDLADTAGAAGLFARARDAAGGRIDALVNSASAFEFDGVPAIDPILAARLYAINCTTPLLLAQALAAQDDVTDGAVVNLLDQKVGNLNPDYLSYTCAKIALEGATTLLAQALAPRVRVNAVSPGLTLPSGEQNAAEFAAVASQNLLQHPVGTENVAAAVVWLIEASSVTGQNIYVDCGQRFLKRDGDVMFDTVVRPGG